MNTLSCGVWSCVCLLLPSPPVPENNVWGNPELAGTGLWKWLPLRGHSRQSLYSPPPLGQSGDRDKITRVLQSQHVTPINTHGRGGKTTAARIIPTYSAPWMFSLGGTLDLLRSSTSGSWESISAHQHINSLCWMMWLLRLWRQRVVPEAGLVRLEWGSWPLSLDFYLLPAWGNKWRAQEEQTYRVWSHRQLNWT